MNVKKTWFTGGIVPLLLCVAPLPVHGQGENIRFVEIPGTRSADQKLAIAWGMIGDGNLVVTQSGAVFARPEPSKVRNYLVDLRKRQVLATLNTRYSEGVVASTRGDGLEALWFPDGSAVIVAETKGGQTGSVDVVQLPDLKVIDLGDAARSAFTQRIRRDWLYYPMENLRITFSGFRVAGPDRICVVAKAKPAVDWMPDIVQDYTAVWHGGTRISLHEAR